MKAHIKKEAMNLKESNGAGMGGVRIGKGKGEMM